MSRFPLVGRTAALAQLDDALAAGRRSAGGLVLLTGEPGIGKTRLAEEAADHARDFRIIWCRCDPTAAAPYRPWLRLLAAVGGDPGTLSSAGVGYDAAVDRFDAFDRVIDQLAMASSDRPLLVIFDDVHDADPSSLELLVHAATQLKGSATLLLATARDADSAWRGRLASWAELLRASRILSLTPLSIDEVGALIIGGGQPVAPDTLRAVARRTDGNPLLVTELVGYLRAHGRLGDPGDRPGRAVLGSGPGGGPARPLVAGRGRSDPGRGDPRHPLLAGSAGGAAHGRADRRRRLVAPGPRRRSARSGRDRRMAVLPRTGSGRRVRRDRPHRSASAARRRRGRSGPPVGRRGHDRPSPDARRTRARDGGR